MHLFFLTLLFVSCASPIKLQKKTDSHGYTAKELSNNRHLEIIVSLPPEVSNKTKINYGRLAALEECKIRGYEFVDWADSSTNRYEARCYPKNEIKRLGIVFLTSGLEQSPNKFIVEDTNNKPATMVKPDDEILSVAGVKILSMTDVKSIVHSQGEADNFLSLKLIRNGKTITVKEPLLIMKDTLLGKSELEMLRSDFE